MHLSCSSLHMQKPLDLPTRRPGQLAKSVGNLPFLFIRRKDDAAGIIGKTGVGRDFQHLDETLVLFRIEELIDVVFAAGI